MKAYILTENDMELLKTTMERWEEKFRGRYPIHAGGTEVANAQATVTEDVLRSVRYDLWGWIQGVKK